MATFEITIEERATVYEARLAYIEANSWEEAQQLAEDWDFDDYGDTINSEWYDSETVEVLYDTLAHVDGELEPHRPKIMLTRRVSCTK